MDPQVFIPSINILLTPGDDMDHNFENFFNVPSPPPSIIFKVEKKLPVQIFVDLRNKINLKNRLILILILKNNISR